jgi:ribosomal protein L16 Arg81 hydroxylase
VDRRVGWRYIMHVLRDWLGDLPLDVFRRDYLQARPLAQPSTTHAAAPLLDWQVLERVLAVAPDVLVVAGGKLLELPVPRDRYELRGYLRMGIGLCMRHTERCDPGLRSVADAFETDVGSAQVQLFVTPAGTHGFSWHFDDEDVFIAQTVGVKDYFFRDNTVTEGLAHPAAFQRFAEEASPIHTARLTPGDFLYIPARWWHMAECQEDALSISVGVRPSRPSGAPAGRS